MNIAKLKYCLLEFVLLFSLSTIEVAAQEVLVPRAQQHRQHLPDSVTLSSLGEELDSMQRVLLAQAKDSLARIDSLMLDTTISVGRLMADSVYAAPPIKKVFIPDPKKSLWFAIAFPGGGQIYNRKYWKLPIVYGGFLGCYYALSWNNNMYRDYSQAYIDIMDDDPKTNSYESWLPPSYDVKSNMEHLKDVFRRKKDFYRRYRDMSFYCLLAVYALSIIDAYVDAELSSFDISPDLSLKVKPSVFNDGNRYMASKNPLKNNSFGLQCSIDF